MSCKVCVVIPAYNASDTIETIVKKALKYCPVIVADDGSDDNTAFRAKQAGAEVIQIQKNSGKGNVLKLLFNKAMQENYEAVITLDADGQHDPDDIVKFLREYEHNPNSILIGSRMNERHLIPPSRYNSMRVAGFYISFASNQFIEDTQCGFRLYPLSIIKDIELITGHYLTETELIMKAGDSGLKIKSVPIKTIYQNNKSYFRPIKDVAMITSYVMLYLITKWNIECFTIGNDCTYRKGGIHDKMIRNKVIFFFLNTLAVFFSIPFTFFWLILFQIASLAKINNFYSVRKKQLHFIRITLSTLMLLFILPVALIDKTLKVFFNLNLTGQFISLFYPELR